MSHEFASAVVSVIGSFFVGSQFLKICLSRPTSIWPVHWIGLDGLSRPSWIPASAVTGLNVEPGG